MDICKSVIKTTEQAEVMKYWFLCQEVKYDFIDSDSTLQIDITVHEDLNIAQLF